jgi:protein phosphatase
MLATVKVGAFTDAGRRRPINEDSIIAQGSVFIVADGMGGHEAGDKASGIVAEEMSALATRADVDIDLVKATLDAARARILGLAAQDKRHAAGTTVSGVVVVNQNGLPYWLVVNLGDSRTYRLAGGHLEQLSIDHSEVQEMVDAGRISSGAARVHPRRNVVTRALGAGIVDHPDYWLLPIEEGDRILVCSDGLTSEVADDVIEAVLLANPDPHSGAAALLTAALESGGRDNVSVIVVDAWDVAGQGIEEMTVDESVGGDDDTIPRAPALSGGQP